MKNETFYTVILVTLAGSMPGPELKQLATLCGQTKNVEEFFWIVDAHIVDEQLKVKICSKLEELRAAQ